MSMKQPKTEYEGKDSSGGRKTSPDSSKTIREPVADRHRSGKGETGEREPKGSKSSDGGGEKHVRMIAGVGMGKADRMGADETGDGRSNFGKHEGVVGEFNEGRKEGICYTHKRLSHPQN